jgi:hypothetical protein
MKVEVRWWFIPDALGRFRLACPSVLVFERAGHASLRLRFAEGVRRASHRCFAMRGLFLIFPRPRGEIATLVSLVDAHMSAAILPASAVEHGVASVVACGIADRIPMSEIPSPSVNEFDRQSWTPSELSLQKS